MGPLQPLPAFLLIAPHLLTARAAMVSQDVLIRKQRDIYYLRQFWMFLGAVLLFFTLVNIARKVYALLSRHPRSMDYAPPLKASLKRDTEKGLKVSPQASTNRGRLSRISASCSTAFRIVSFRWSLWIGPYNMGSLGELVFILLYISINVIWLLIDTNGLKKNFYKARAGMIATSQLPLVVALANKNSIVSLLTGVSHEKLNVLHRASARTVFIFLWIHVIARVLTGLPPHDSWSDPFMQAGIAGIAALTAATFLSVRFFRDTVFEFFFFSHVVLMLIFVITAFIHVHPLGFGYLVWPAFVLWGLDRALRLGGMLWNNLIRCTGENKAKATVELLTPDTIRLRMKRKFSWKAGQHAYVCIPKLSQMPFEFHPFTISTIAEDLSDGTRPDEKEVDFLIRVRGGLTRRLKKFANANGSAIVTAYVDGPYGSPPEVHWYSTAILVAGGSGISYTLPVLLDLIRRSATGAYSEARRVKFVWIVRGEGHLPWINEILSGALAKVKSPLVVDACIYVTGTDVTQENRPAGSISLSEKDIVYVEPESSGDTMRAEIYHGRPELHRILDDEVTGACGPVSVDIAGPAGLTKAVKEALSIGAASVSSSLKGNYPVTLHVETFAMQT